MEHIKISCRHPQCRCEGKCCQDCEEAAGCDNTCSRVLYREAVYASPDFLLQQVEELALLSGHWLIQVAAQRIRHLQA